jgi:hypothetical protein
MTRRVLALGNGRFQAVFYAGGLPGAGWDGSARVAVDGRREKAPAGPGDVRLFRSPGHHRNFIDCVKKRENPVCDVEIGCRSVTVCHLGNIAYWTRKPFGWDPKKEMILGNDKAAEWLDRPKRAPWKLAT